LGEYLLKNAVDIGDLLSLEDSGTSMDKKVWGSHQQLPIFIPNRVL